MAPGSIRMKWPVARRSPVSMSRCGIVAAIAVPKTLQRKLEVFAAREAAMRDRSANPKAWAG
jgi:hypothetical protein